MKIIPLGCNQELFGLSFGKKDKNNKTKNNHRNRPKQTDWRDSYPKTSRHYGVNTHPDRKEYTFDINKIMMLDAPASKEQKAVPFEEGHAKFTTDKYQQEAINAYTGGKSTIVCAPTGTGKTLIAEYAIKDTLDKGKKIIYTSPLKALSNEKYTDFAKLFGEYDEEGNLINTDKVGLLTGDVSINPDAPCLVMTTEIYKNSLMQGGEDEISQKYKEYDGVIYDEFHYLGDYSRGSVWEEAVMYTPKHMKQLMLSATASNADEIKKWISDINQDIETCLVNVPESERHVPLRELVLVKDTTGQLTFEPIKKQRCPLKKLRNPNAFTDRQKQAYDELKETIGLNEYDDIIAYFKNFGLRGEVISQETISNGLQYSGATKERADAVSLILSDDRFSKYKKYPDNGLAQGVKMTQVINLIHEENMDPALIYIFSKKKCDSEFDYAAKYGKSLLTPKESKQVYNEIAKAQENGIYLGSDFDDKQIVGLMKGYAVHHAGKLPAYKSLVENLARQGLIKTCFATETLIAGINMPFRTTVFTQLDKYSDEDGGKFTDISTSTYKQGAGRAGRRGKDELGNVIILAQSKEDYDLARALSSSKDTSIKSKESPSYASVLSDRILNNKEEALLRGLGCYQQGSITDKCDMLIESKFKILEQFGYIEKQENGEYVRTQKGEAAKSVYGINEIILTELLYNPDYLQNLDEDGLIAVLAPFADTKDENPSLNFDGDLSYLNNNWSKITNLVKKVDNAEIEAGIKEMPVQMSTTLTPYVVQFANTPKDRDESLQGWHLIMNDLISNELILHEGDFLRIVNGTIDILRMTAQMSPDENVRNTAQKAISKMMKAPVVDVLTYELGAKTTPEENLS
ncbi:MAG: DEAD/DEAH box helicase [Candidatus Gastranaerophilales bacterium]|nr:DEAD/DEAH box helicase [Candidatus Gastranaerophilales bacterium]